MKYKPMLLTPTESLPEGEEWGYQLKLDGYRMMGEVSPDRTLLVSRHGTYFTDRFPLVAAGLMEALQGCEAVVDGELVGLDEHGRESFAELQRSHARAVLFIFDLLEVQREPVIDLPLRDRLQLLGSVVAPSAVVRPVAMVYNADLIARTALENNMEGVVAKRMGSRYRPGRRSRDWQKLKYRQHPERQWRR